MTRDGDTIDEALQSLSFGRVDEGEGPSARTRDSIRKAVMADLHPVQAVSLPKRVGYVLATGLASAALVVVSYGAAGLHGLQRHLVATFVAGLVATLAALAIGGSFTPKLQASLGGSHRRLALAALVVAWTLYVASHVTDQALGSALAGPALGCGLRSVTAGLLGAGAFLFIFRRTDPWTPRTSGALIGACAATIASAGVGIPCAAEHGGHLFVGHWLAVPLLALAGALVGRKVLEP